AALHTRFARLPAAAAEPIKLDAGLLRAVAREQFDVLDWEEQPIAASVVQFEAVMRRARRLDGAQPREAADAVVNVDHEIPGRKARHLGDETVRSPRGTARPHQAIAQDVLLADHGGIGGFRRGAPGRETQGAPA